MHPPHRIGYRIALGALAFLPALAQAAPFSHGLLWRLDKPGVPPSYVFGTLHSNDARATALPASVGHALDRSRRFAMEIYLSDAGDEHFLEATQFDDDRRLKPLLGEELYARLRQALGTAAPPAEVLERTKPWAALLRAAATHTAGTGPTLDQLLLLTAKERHMELIALEGLDEQIAAFDGIPLETQVALVSHVLDHRAELEAQTESTLGAWLDRDLEALSRINRRAANGNAELARHYAILTHHIVENRSVLMAHRLFLPLRQGRVFIAVGALHLYGQRGLLALLEAQGFRIQRVY